MLREGLNFSRFSHLKVSAAKHWGVCSSKCLQLLGISIQLDLLQNKSWPEPWLLGETAVGWDLHVASSEVSIEQTRLGKKGASCEKPWWYLWKEETANGNSTASRKDNLSYLDVGHSPMRVSLLQALEGKTLSRTIKKTTQLQHVKQRCPDIIITVSRGFELKASPKYDILWDLPVL